MTAIAIGGSVVVEPHAVEQARARIDGWAGWHRNEIRREIELRIREAYANGSVFDRKPKAFRRYGETRRATPIMPAQRYVVHGDSLFVVDLGRSPDVYVVTTYVKQARVLVL